MAINQITNPPLALVHQASTALKPSTAANSTVAANDASNKIDAASLSAAGTLLLQALRTPDVRTEKVAALQASIAAGTYNVSSADVANKLVETLLS